MSEVRRHERQTASGKRTTVRHHTRGGERTRREDEAEAAREAWADRNAPHVSALPPAEPEPQAQEWWAEDDMPPPGAFWADDDEVGNWHGAPEQDEPSAAFKAMLAQNPSIGDGFSRLRHLRESGYEGPVDQDGNPTDRKAARKAAVARLDAAQEYLGAYYCDTEDDEYHRRNDAVNEALKDPDLPWWRRNL